VIDSRLFQFLLMEIGNWVGADQSTGRLIHIPNGKVFTEALANYSRGFEYIWNEIPVLVTFESDWEKSKQILQALADEHGAQPGAAAQPRFREASRQFPIIVPETTPTVYTSVQDSGVLLTIRYLCEVRRRRDSAQAIWEDILRAFAKHADIDFAYPTQRLYNNALEGKEGARPLPAGIQADEHGPAM
jgi:small-conductance mechanosensitive channel